MATLGKLRQQVYTHLAEQYTNKEGFKSSFNKVMSVLNENEDLKRVFNIYTDIERRHINSKEIASEFIVEAVNTIKSLMTENYVEGVKKLNTLVGNTVCEQNDITKHLDVLVHNTGYETLIERIESKDYIVNTLCQEKTVTESTNPVSQSILTSLLVTKFNEKFDVMTESEKETFKRYSEMTQEEITTTVTEIKAQVKESIETLKSNDDLKSVVMEVEQKVETCGNDLFSLLKLEELRTNLS